MTSYKQGSYVSRVLNTAEAAHCSTLILYLHALYLLLTVPMGISLPPHCTVPTCKVSVSDQLYLLRYFLTKKRY